MDKNKVIIKYKNAEGDKMDISWTLHPDSEIEDLYYAFDSAKNALLKIVKEKAKKEGITSEKSFFKWVKRKTIRDLKI